MRVVAAEHRRAASACGAVRSEKRGGVDLEMARGVCGDVGGGADGGDRAVAGAEQQTAAFEGVRAGGLTEKSGNNACFDADIRHLGSMDRNDAAPQGTISGILASTDRLDRALGEALAAMPGAPTLSRARLQALIGEGQVRVGGRVITQTSAKFAAGSGFVVALPAPAPLAAPAQAIPLVVAYEDADLIVVDKPAGLVVHPAAGNPDGTLVNALLHHCGGTLSGIGGVARPGIVHRIDKDTSGLIVAAKTDAAHTGLARQFAAHSIARAYLAITAGWPVAGEGTIAGTLGRSATNRKKMVMLEAGATRGKHAITHYRVLRRLGAGSPDGRARAALVECRLETGRTHQVRVQLASIGHALLGDPLYGGAAKPHRALLAELGFARQALHAAELGFVHPVSGEELHFTSPLPADIAELLARLEEI